MFFLPLKGFRTVVLLTIGLLGVATAQAQDDAEQAKLFRLTMITGMMQPANADVPTLLAEAAKLCGFSVCTEERSVLFRAPDDGSLHINVTDVELKEYAHMYRAGQGTNLVDLIGTVDSMLKKIGYEKSCKGMVMKWLQTGTESKDPGTKAVTTFLRQLGSFHRDAGDMLFTDKATLDSVQSLFILRILTEEIVSPIRKRYNELKKPPTLLELVMQPNGASFVQSEDFKNAANYAQDDIIGGVTGLLSEVANHVKFLPLQAVAKLSGYANPMLMAIKFVATYVLLNGEVKMESGTQLVRTKKSGDNYGEEKTLVAHFYFDQDEVTQFFKDNRLAFSAVGLDTDAPAGDLNGVETSWAFKTPIPASEQTFRMAKDEVTDNPSIRITDSEGKARYKIEGTPQQIEMDPSNAIPLVRKYVVEVTPQVKKDSAAQDATDLVLGMITSHGNAAVGAATAMAEYAYRLKWLGKVKYTLEVKDWVPDEEVASLYLHVRASTQIGGTINQTLDAQNIVVFETHPTPPPELLDESFLKYLTKAQQEEAKAAVKKAHETKYPNIYSFTANPMKGEAKYNISIHDFLKRGITKTECWTGEDMVVVSRKNPTKIASLTIAFDYDKNQVVILGGGIITLEHGFHQTDFGGEDHYSGKPEAAGFFDRVSASNIVLPLSAKPGMSEYSGSGSVPIETEVGPGTLDIRYSIHKKSKKAG